MTFDLHGDFIIWGARGHGKVLRSVIESYGGAVVAIVDNDQSALEGVVRATPIFGSVGLREFISKRGSQGLSGAIAVGGSRAIDRLWILDEFRRLGVSMPPIVDRNAIQELGSRISEGCQLLAGSILGADATLGAASIVNHNAVVDHECVIERGVHIAPSATLCGCVHVGEGAFIGAGATVLPRLTIGANAIIGAGALVTKNVEAGVTVAGVPAKIFNIENEARQE